MGETTNAEEILVMSHESLVTNKETQVSEEESLLEETPVVTGNQPLVSEEEPKILEEPEVLEKLLVISHESLVTKYNFHTHSYFSDGARAPEEYVIEALKQGFKGLGFSEHSVLPFANTFALQQGREAEYCEEISRLKVAYNGLVSVYTGMEADYIPEISENLRGLKNRLQLDYIIGSVHLVKGPAGKDKLWFIDGPKRETYDEGIEQVFDGDIKAAITAYWHQVNRMIENEEFDVVGHLDKIKMHNKGRWFDESSGWYTALVDETIELIAQKDLLVEINTRGIYKGRSETFFPGEEILKKLNEKGVRIVLSSDAHHPTEIALYFNEAIEMLKQCGYTSAWIFEDSLWTELPLNMGV
jgi:histidinol-phosphatase (PHP family)